MAHKLVQKVKLFVSYMMGHRRQVAAAVIGRDGKILIARRKRSDTMGGYWEFPGGKVEPGETPEMCLKRELKEEFGIDAEIGPFFASSVFTYYRIPIELVVYSVERFSGEINVNDHEEARWVTPGELCGYDFVSPDRPVVEKLTRLSRTP
jgi:8-oxo-dGTP diphosphatase